MCLYVFITGAVVERFPTMRCCLFTSRVRVVNFLMSIQICLKPFSDSMTLLENWITMPIFCGMCVCVNVI